MCKTSIERSAGRGLVLSHLPMHETKNQLTLIIAVYREEKSQPKEEIETQ